VAILLVRHNTMETIEAIDKVFGKTRLGETAKLKQYQKLLEEHLNYPRLKEMMGLK
jgi:BioD-like phosphotransacetylase family protein